METPLQNGTTPINVVSSFANKVNRFSPEMPSRPISPGSVELYRFWRKRGRGGQSSTNQFQRRPPMQCYVISFVALDLVLWVIFGRMMRVAFVDHILCVYFDDPSRDLSGFRVPCHRVVEFEFFHHGLRPQSLARACSQFSGRTTLGRLSRHPFDNAYRQGRLDDAREPQICAHKQSTKLFSRSFPAPRRHYQHLDVAHLGWVRR